LFTWESHLLFVVVVAVAAAAAVVFDGRGLDWSELGRLKGELAGL